jgi:hypothetical protein
LDVGMPFVTRAFFSLGPFELGIAIIIPSCAMMCFV